MRAITDGINQNDPAFGYAEGSDGDTYKGLVFAEPGKIYFNDNSIIVRPELAQKQIEAERNITLPSPEIKGHPTPVTHPTEPSSPPKPKLKRRYHGTVSIDPQRVNREVGTIVEEIVEQLTTLTDTNVTIKLEISAERYEGFSEQIVRTISENSRVLKFISYEFEED